MKNEKNIYEIYTKILFSLIYTKNIDIIIERSTEDIKLLENQANSNKINYFFENQKINSFSKFFKPLNMILVKNNQSTTYFNIYICKSNDNIFLNILKRLLLYFYLIIKQIFSSYKFPIMIGLFNKKLFLRTNLIDKSQIEIRILKLHLLKNLCKQIIRYLFSLMNYDLLVIKGNK